MKYDHQAALAQDRRAVDIYRRLRAARQAQQQADAADARRANLAVGLVLAAGAAVALWVILRGV